jgi:radical SAM protein with 4Fe4S-binding SPASM domain
MPNELNFNEARQAINEMAFLGTEALMFSGGEPLLRKDFVVELSEFCHDVGIIPAMLSNGVLINHKTALELKEAGIMAVGIPIDSIHPEVHDNLRNVPGTFKKVLKGIQACLDVDLEVVVTTMALKSNFAEIPQTIEFISSLGVNQVAIYDLVPNGRGKNILDQVMLKEQREDLIKYLQRMQEEKEMIFVFSGGNPLYAEIASEIHRREGTSPPDLLLKQFWIHAPVGCHAGINYFSLRPNGDVYPCPFLQIKTGNIRETSITKIWSRSPVLETLRNRSKLKGKCGECKYREACGGCRGRAYANSGDYMAEDPICLESLLSEENVYPASVKCFGRCVG